MDFMINIKNNTKELHLASEKSGFIKRLIEGRASNVYIYNIAISIELDAKLYPSHV